METLWQDLKYGARMLTKSPVFTVTAILTLALGIGANVAIYSVLTAIFFSPLPYPDSDQLIQIYENNPKQGWSQLSVSYLNWQDWREQNQTFEDIALYGGDSFNLSGDGEPVRARGLKNSANLFNVLGRMPVAGRNFVPEDDAPGAEPVVVLSYSLWQRRYGGNQDILNRTILLNSIPHTVIGMMPQDFYFSSPRTELWTTLRIDSTATQRGSHRYGAIGRLKSGTNSAQAHTDLEVIAQRLEKEYPDTNTDYGITTKTRSAVFFDREDYLIGAIVYLAVVFVLLIACANVANLLLSRGASREKEVAIRMSQGAGRNRLLRQFLTESTLLGLLGGLAGIGLAYWSVQGLLMIIPRGVPSYDKIALDQPALLYAAALSLLTGLLFGLAPALQSTKPDVAETLKEGGRSSSAGSRHRLLKSLVVAEVALAMILLAASGLLVRSFQKKLGIDPGFSTSNLLTLRTALPEVKYESKEQRDEFYRQLVERMQAIPRVESVGATFTLPLSGSNSWSNFTIEGRPALQPGEQITAGIMIITPDYFRAMGIKLLQGRFFDDQDTLNGQQVVIINETMAKKFWPDEEVLGRRFNRGGSESELPVRTIVGVVADVRHENLGTLPRPEMYLPHAQRPQYSMTIVARTTVDPLTLVSAAREAVWSVDPDQSVFAVRSMDQVLLDRIDGDQVQARVMGILGLVALLLAGLGIYGVITYSVSERTHEIGVRMALGAGNRDIFKFVFRQGLTPVAIGLGLGLVGAFALTRVMSSLLFGISPTDPVTYGSICMMFVLVALLAGYIPARRATQVDPMVALRYE